MEKCSVMNCDLPAKTRSLCNAHYLRMLRHGDPTKGAGPRGTSSGSPRRFLNEIVLTYSGDDCLIWPFAKDGSGYGQMMHDGNRHSAVHRIVCRAVHGDPPPDKPEAAHVCGKGHLGCVSPKHLIWKSRIENKADEVDHGARNRGERNGVSKLTEPQVRTILTMKGASPASSVAMMFGVSTSLISAIWRRKRWAWLDHP